MKKTFAEVFPSLKLEREDLKNIIKYLLVTNIKTSKNFDKLSIYVESDRLIDKESLCNLENFISKSLFYNKNLEIKIYEKFNLASIYTPQNFYDLYKESIIYELKKYSMKYYILFINTDFFFNDNEVELSVEDTALNRFLIAELIRILEKIFIERCGLNVIFSFKFDKLIVNETMEEKIINSYYETNKNIKIEEFVSLDTLSKGNNNLQADKNVKDNSVSKLKKQEKSAYLKKEFVKNINPDLIYGKDFLEDFILLKDIVGEMGEVSVRGKIIDLDTRFFEKTSSTMFKITLTDFTDSIIAKIFVKENYLENFTAYIKKGASIKLRGVSNIDSFDGELCISSISGIKKCEDISSSYRKDTAKEKRVELHCHTKMSEHDGVSSEEDLIKTAYSWGWDALALTDHGNVQAFTTANHILEDLNKKGDREFKLLYGVEGYVVDDLKELVFEPKNYTFEDSFVVFDIETTGLISSTDKIIEIGAVKIIKGKIVDSFNVFVNPKIPVPFKIQELTGISDYMLIDAKTIDEVLPEFLDFCKDTIAVAHNASFDTGFIKAKAKELNLEYNPSIIDTVSLARLLLPQLSRFKLDTVSKALGIKLLHHHRAVDDARATANIFLEFIKILKERGVYTLKDLSSLSKSSIDIIKKSRANHIIIIAKNDIGRINLYRLISLSHINYFNKVPRIPKSVLKEYREGLIIGSACEAGELYEALINQKDDLEIERIIEFYDYLEIQPVENNQFMLNSDKYYVNTKEDLQDLNKKIIELGKKYNKLVCATCDAHFLNPENDIYRKIIMYGKGFLDADTAPPLYLRTTDEMLKEFSYLGDDLAYEVVVKNTRKIADMVEYIKPVRPDKCPPVIENSDIELREACYTKAHEQYGKNLPEIVEKRLEKELNSIINNGFAVMYIIAKKLVEKSMEDGYLVGSRGSVGSSFAAYTAGITEVNPLPPHYYCKCGYTDFTSEDVKSFSGMAGADMPNKECPNCGNKLKKDGFDIPFETFLGFKGDKEPDIDLNFSGEYQAKAHAFTEEIFGKGHTFRAGTVGTMAFKTAFGYVKKYYEEHGIRKRNAEISRISNACEGIKRTTGQHPGGIIVLPHGEEIHSFTPVQRPANDMNVDTITTHFDYHAIDHNLLKLDILGHMDPTMMRMLADLTGIDPVRDIPLDSKETMSLFKNTSALGITPDDIMGTPLGALGIPEFGTDFAMQMLIEAKPEGISDLIRISGLSHGTDVWLNNAQDLIKEGKATIRTAICTRDDIMVYLIYKGLDESRAFNIMESVRKGKGLKPEDEEYMIEKGVPDWYIWSCKQIKYMFPKAHAAAYVMMAWRIAYCKIYYPLEYYTAFFTIRASAFSYELMCFGKEKLEYNYKLLLDKKNNKTATNKEEETLKDMRIVQEMYARGFEFEPIDIYKAKAKKFIITENKKIMPSLESIDGLGEVAALSIEEAVKKGKFISKEDFKLRAKVGNSTTELLDKFSLLGKIPKNNQMSIFDMI